MGKTILGFIVSFLCTIFLLTKIPTPMDVYQGKTTLQYKIVDGEKIDSIVVWKKYNLRN